jgi:hypothetical protein
MDRKASVYCKTWKNNYLSVPVMTNLGIFLCTYILIDWFIYYIYKQIC